MPVPPAVAARDNAAMTARRPWRRSRRPAPYAVAALLATALPLGAQNCSQTSVGFVPLDDPAGGSYQGFPLGLWPNGLDVPPAAHRNAGLQQAQAVVPLDAAGSPSPQGRIVLLSIG